MWFLLRFHARKWMFIEVSAYVNVTNLSGGRTYSNLLYVEVEVFSNSFNFVLTSCITYGTNKSHCENKFDLKLGSVRNLQDFYDVNVLL